MRTPPEPDGSALADYIVLGRVAGVFGVRGWIKVMSETRPRANIVHDYPHWYLREANVWERVAVTEGKPHGKTVIARLAGVDDRDAAEALIGREIAVTRAMLPEADDDEVYWTDLVGCEVHHVDGTRLGSVLRLFETGANDVLVLADERDPAAPRREILVPWLRPDVITAVDLGSRRVVVDWDPDF